jgi:hypothetical protein
VTGVLRARLAGERTSGSALCIVVPNSWNTVEICADAAQGGFDDGYDEMGAGGPQISVP